MLSPGDVLALTIDKAAAGGRMIARANGQVVLVSGAIPGERVTARIERVAKGVAYAATVRVDEPSADRRQPSAGPAVEPLCGGCLYAAIAYPRQIEIKASIVVDAFARIAKVPLPSAVTVAPSPEEGYRMRARLHVRGGRIGFYREGTHDLCDVRSTQQLLSATCDVLDRLSGSLGAPGLDGVHGLELSENIDASERVVQLDTTAAIDPGVRESLGRTDGLTGLVAGTGIHGSAFVADRLRMADGGTFLLRRHVGAFFQGNRYLLEALVAHVVALVPPASAVIDLYAGSGLFSLALAASGAASVIAVEGDPLAASDLVTNVAGWNGGTVRAIHQSVEGFVASAGAPRVGRPGPAGQIVIVDPPRTGMSREALDGVIRLRAASIIYVSCDPATLARDARRLADARYRVRRIDAFDLFPNTPHVETVVVFDR